MRLEIGGRRGAGGACGGRSCGSSVERRSALRARVPHSWVVGGGRRGPAACAWRPEAEGPAGDLVAAPWRGRLQRSLDRPAVGRAAAGDGGEDAAGVRVASAQSAREWAARDARRRL